VNTKTQLIAFFLFALMVNSWHLPMLMGVMLILLLVLVMRNNQHFFSLMRRLKWFYLVMLLIFVFNTPGEHIAAWPLDWKPTYEGVDAGLEQVLRIAVMLAAISIVLMQNTKQQLISGLYFLMKPFSFLGLNAKRFAARLWLTLHYVELQQADTEKPRLTEGLAHYLNDIVIDDGHDDVAIKLDNPAQTWVDYVVITFMLLLLIFGVVV